MAEAAILASALNTATAIPYGLFIGGLNVLKEPGGGFGMQPETIRLTEAGPGSVSQLSARISDPGKEVTVPEGTDVAYWDLANNVCLFRGWADNAAMDPDFGDQGRRIYFECTGVEAVLDWTAVPSGVSFLNGVRTPHNIGLLAQQYAPILRAPSQASGMGSAPYTRNGSFTYPIGSMARPAEPSLPTQFATATTTGGTLRQAIGQALELSSWLDLGSGNFPGEPVAALVTVDFMWGLRVWEDDASLQPDDYTTLTIVDTAAGTTRGADLSTRVDWISVVRSVTVQGSGGIVYGPFGDGSGIYGRSVLLTDTTIASEDVARTKAKGYMAQIRATTRGDFTLEDWTPPTTVHAGSLVAITDAATGLATTHRIMQIDKTFLNNGRQTWRVTFGGLAAPSLSRAVRRATRFVTF